MPEKGKITVGNWIAIASLVLSISVAMGVIGSQIFASKSDIHAVSLKQENAQGKDELHKWRIDTIQVRTTNTERLLLKVDTNVTRMLERLRVKPAPEPRYDSLPALPNNDGD